ncbi:MAG: TonB-dependent receptor [Anaerolineales bacterium]|nr:TonB-dependent receptor [Anaerolineales bacterium]
MPTTLSFLLLAAFAPAAGQSVTTGSIHGSVVDADGVPIVDARVAATSAASGLTRSTRTDRRGRFRLPLLLDGQYHLVAEQLGYRPHRIREVPVRPGRTMGIEIALDTVAPPVQRAQEVPFTDPALGGSRAGSSQRLSDLELRGVPHWSRELATVMSASSLSDSSLAAQGLPGSMAGVWLDGLPIEPAGQPWLSRSPMPTLPIHVGAAESAELLQQWVDVEVGGAGAILSSYGRTGSDRLRVDAFGGWVGGEETSGTVFGQSIVPQDEIRAGMMVRGPLIQDTATFSLGVEAFSRDTPMPPLLEGDSEALLAAAATNGVDLAPVTNGLARRSEVVSGFGTLDWSSRDHQVSIRGNFGTVPSRSLAPGILLRPGLGKVFNGTDIATSASLRSLLSPRIAQELRIGFGLSQRRFGPSIVEESAAARPLPSTRVAGLGWPLGVDPLAGTEASRLAFAGAQAFHLAWGFHRLKAGVSFEISSHEYSSAPGTGGEFVFGGAEELEGLEGSFRQTTGRLDARFGIQRYALFVQDLWQLGPDFELQFGLRYDIEGLPTEDVRRNEDWEQVSGLSNTTGPGDLRTVGPRFGFSWDVGARHRWIVRGGVGVYTGGIDPGLVAELLAYDQGVEVRKGVGSLGQWPEAPDPAAAPVVGDALTLWGPDFRPPRTSRASLGLTGVLWSKTALHVSALYRHTEFLPVRTDLNLIPAPVTENTYGQPIYGRLVRHGQAVTAEPGSNRRFDSFDRVTAVNAAASSDHWSLTTTLEHRETEAVEVVASYTYSRTMDDWLGAGGRPADALLVPGAAGPNDWQNGVSDFDVPHRAVLAARVQAPIPLKPQLSGVLRVQSEAPFTPTFPPTVDANGDGIGGNEPVYLDGTVPGVTELLGEWECLRDQVGGVVARNSCRGPVFADLDLRLSLQVLGGVGVDARLVVDALNLIQNEVSLRDHALYILDPEGTITTEGSITAMPLMANPRFGQPLTSFANDRLLRVGFEVGF